MADQNRIRFGNGIEINARNLTTDSVTIDGTAGQLFSVTNNLTSGSIFSVNDVSGIPSIDVDASGTIQLAAYNTSDYIGIGITNPISKLQVIGNVNIQDGLLLHSRTSGSQITLTVTVAAKTSAHRYFNTGSSNGYFINGVEAPVIHLEPGVEYKFDQSDSSNTGHPLLFYLLANKTSSYTATVTTSGTPGQAGAYTNITATDATPSQLHYMCSAHDYMGNTAFVTNGYSAQTADFALDASHISPSLETTDTTTFPVFVTNAGYTTPRYNTSLTYNSATGQLGATSFSGSGINLTGLTGASVGTYGDATNSAQISVDSNGRITGITQVAISGGGGGGGVSESLAIAYAVAL